MNSVVRPTQSDVSHDAACWRELVLLLQRKAYKANITPEEIAAELPDLREVYRAWRSSAPVLPSQNGQ